MSLGGELDKHELAEGPIHDMDQAVLLADPTGFAEAYRAQLAGITFTNAGSPLEVKSLGVGYIHPGENYGSYSLAHGLVSEIRARRGLFEARDAVFLQKMLEDPSPLRRSLAAIGDSDASTEARLERYMREFLVEVAFKLGHAYSTEPPLTEEIIESLSHPTYDQWAEPGDL